MSVRVSCPFCNHRVVLPAVPAAGRAVCDRCGETFPVTGAVEEVADPAPAAAPSLAHPAAVQRLRLAVALALSVLSVPVIFYLGYLARQRTPVPAPPQVAGPVTWPPPIVPLLRHLPADTGVAFAVQPGPLLAHAKRTDTDPRKLLADLGVPDRAFTTLADLGLSLDRIDQLAGGLSLPTDNAVPRFVLAVKLTGPAGDLLEKLKAERVATGRYRAVLGGLPVRLEERGRGVRVRHGRR